MQTIYQCDSNGREKNTVAADMDGTLLIETSSFPYFALIAFDVGGILRLFLLLLATPFSWICYHFVSESAGIRVLIFATFSGVRVSAIKSAASAILPKYYSEDLHPETWRMFSSCGRKCVLTANPRIMVEPFLTNYLGVDVVLGTEISSYRGIATGLVASPGLLVGKNKATALKDAFGTESMPDIGIGDRESDFPFMNLCKERYIVLSKPGVRPVRQEKLPKPVIFHDGRLVQKPTPLVALLIILWFPIAIPLSSLRILFGTFCPFSIIFYVFPLLGCPITVKGIVPHVKRSPRQRGVLFVSSHKTVLDPSYISGCLGLKATAVAYSVPNFSLLLTQLKTVTLTRDRTKDAELIEQALSEGEYLVICPEGTTCREPYLLRFSSLFAELTDQIVPVAVDVNMSLFHGSTARGYKVLDPFFFFMNPLPRYEITFLAKLTSDQIDGQSCHEIANSIQEMIAAKLDFKCTNFTRKDKYRTLAGTDGLVGQKPRRKVEDCACGCQCKNQFVPWHDREGL